MAYHKVLNLFKEKVKEIDHQEMNIKEEIEMMNKNKNPEQKSIRINSESSKDSNASAHKMVRRHSANKIICYTNSIRSEPNDSFYNSKLDELHNEKKEMEKDEEEAKKKEKELEETIMRRLEENMGEDEESEESSQDISSIASRKLEVKDQALMTDFSQKINKMSIELYKNNPNELIKSILICYYYF